MNLLNAIKTLQMKYYQGCAVVIGSDIAALSHMMRDKIKQDSLILYQVSHDDTAKQPRIKNGLADFIDVQVDTTSADAVHALFALFSSQKHQPKLVIFSPEANDSIPTLAITPTQIESSWKMTGYSAFLVAQSALTQMQKAKEGTFLFLGSALATQPVTPWLASSAMQAGIRALAQSLAREFNPQGVHVAYIALAHDAESKQAEKSTELAMAIANSCWHAHKQSKQTWAQEFSTF